MEVISISTSCNPESDTDAILQLKKAEAKRANARARKAASRERIMNDPDRKKEALKRNRMHFKTHYENKLKEIKEVESSVSEHIVPARKKWDQA